MRCCSCFVRLLGVAMLSEGSFVYAAKGTSWMHETVVGEMEEESKRRGTRQRDLECWPTLYRWPLY